MARKTKQNVADSSIATALNPKDPDTKYLGEEPFYSIDMDQSVRKASLVKGFNWYNRFYGKKDAKEFLALYLELNNKLSESRTIRKVDDSEIVNSIGWLSRMTMRGLKLSEEETFVMNNEITRLIQSVNEPKVKKISATGGTKSSPDAVNNANRPNVQEIMRDRAREAAGELEGIFDDYIISGAVSKFNTKTVDCVAKNNILPQHISIITDAWKGKLTEFETILEGKDSQLVQGYSQFTKTQLKNIVKYIEQVLTDLNSYISIKKASKTPRKRKAVPVEKLVSKLKYLKSFKDESMKLDLISISPTKLQGASEAWIYDTAKRKLHHYVADEYSKTFTVKGNTLLGFDTTQSEVKTLRKPNEQLKEIMGSKPVARKFFKDIKAVSTSPNGRFNEQMIILKAF
jgi:hypothetical protein